MSSSAVVVVGDGDPTDPDGDCEPPSDLITSALPLVPGIDSADSP